MTDGLQEDRSPSASTDASQAEDERLLEELYKELRERPAINCPISYSGSADEATLRDALLRFQLQAIFMRRQFPWLTLEALDSIVFNHDYAQALRDVNARVGHECQATSEPSGVGIAMVVHLGEKCVAVLDAGLVHGVLNDDAPDRQAVCMDTAMHELCHLHDHGRKWRLIGQDLRTRPPSPSQQHVFTAADAAWSEYFANKYSHSSYSSPDVHPKLLAEVVPSVCSDIKAAIRAYRLHLRMVDLVALCKQKVLYLFQCFGYAAGRLCASGAALGEVAPESLTALRDAGLEDVWTAVVAELVRLDTLRDEWRSFDELNALMALADTAFRRFGVFYGELTPLGIRVEVPETPDTMPSLQEVLAYRRAATVRAS